MGRTEPITNAIAGTIAEGERVRPPGTQHVARREVRKPALGAEHVWVLPHGVHAMDRDAWNQDDLQWHVSRL